MDHTKVASILSSVQTILGPGFRGAATKEGLQPSSFARAVGESSGKAAIALGALGALGVGMGAYHAVNSQLLLSKFRAALAKVRETNPIVSAAPEDKVNSYAETIFKFAPHIASDPNLLSSILANVLYGEGVDATTIHTLMQMEERYTRQGTPMTTSIVSPLRVG
jgi:hypothetical protein